jgi:hypothetical protein
MPNPAHRLLPETFASLIFEKSVYYYQKLTTEKVWPSGEKLERH